MKLPHKRKVLVMAVLALAALWYLWRRLNKPAAAAPKKVVLPPLPPELDLSPGSIAKYGDPGITSGVGSGGEV